MRVAYLSQTALSDVDFSYIMEAQKIMDITYYILVSPSQRQKAAINLKSLDNKFGIIPAKDIQELEGFNAIVNLDKVFVVNYTSTNNHQISNITEAYKVYRELKQKNYDVIHLTWPPSYLDFFIYRLRKKMVLTVHDPFLHSSYVSKIREYERRRSFKKIDHIILLNKAQKQEFIEYYGLQNKYIHDSRLSCYDYLHLHDSNLKQANSNQLLFFGQIFSHKGIDYLVKAMDVVHKSRPEAKLIVAGSGKYYFDISGYQNCEYVKIINRYIPDFELVELISSSSFIVVPYIDATQSGVIMTAYAFDKPCIATNVGALPEMVVTKENGVIVPPKDIQSLADAIIHLLDNPQEVMLYSKAINAKYKIGYMSWKTIAEEMYSIYESVK